MSLSDPPLHLVPPRGSDLLRVLASLRDARDYAGQITHVESLPAREARYADLDPPLPEPIRTALLALEIPRLYTHQALAVQAARRGEHTVVVTGTASGKTLAFLLPLLERLLEDPQATALLVYPTKALAQDQLKGITRLLAADPRLAKAIRAGVVDGDASGSARRKIRDSANLVLTNPDMLHRGILPYHARWHRLFRHLAAVVLDEVHTYRGIFGAGVGNVLRRLFRIAAHYGAEPRFQASSATIRNPGELTRILTGLPITLIDEDGAPRGPKLFVLWNPPTLDKAEMERRSGNVESKELLVRLIERGLNTIVFAKSRVSAELIYRYAAEELDRMRAGLGKCIEPYRGGYLPSARRETERRLFSGELRGVVSTNALELGIDVGALDAAVLVGFPGTIASVWQQAGRAGRSREEALAIFVAYNDPIDQYLVRNPEYFFAQSPESATCDPANPHVLAGQLACAAFELPLRAEDLARFGETAGGVAEVLRDEGDLYALEGADFWARPDLPAARVNLRTLSMDTVTIVDAADQDRVIGTVDAISAPELVYPEAIYLHEGETYFVQELDLERHLARVRPIAADYYTQPVIDSAIRVHGTREQRDAGTERLALTEVTVSWTTCMLKKLQFGSMDSIGYKSLDLPWQHLETVAFAWAPSRHLAARVKAAGESLLDGLSGVRNLAITVIPLLAMCDRADLGGIIDSSNTGASTLYLYDRFPGGLGFSERGYLEADAVFARAMELLESCPCHEGCPSCVGLPVLRPAQHQDPDSGQGYPIPGKPAARALLAAAGEAMGR